MGISTTHKKTGESLFTLYRNTCRPNKLFHRLLNRKINEDTIKTAHLNPVGKERMTAVLCKKAGTYSFWRKKKPVY
jgi:hypothetical protein